jgi:hypothetical protein
MPRLIDDNTDINPYDTIRGLFGELNGRVTRYGNNKKYRTFCLALGRVQEAASNAGWGHGEDLLGLNKNFGLVWDTIPFGKLDEIQQWFINNAFRKYQIFEPILHAQIMMGQDENSKYYQLYFNSHGQSGKSIKQYQQKELEKYWVNQ